MSSLLLTEVLITEITSQILSIDREFFLKNKGASQLVKKAKNLSLLGNREKATENRE